MKNWILGIGLFACLIAMLLFTGCANTHNVLDVKKDGRIYQRTSDASVGRINMDGDQITAYHGLAPTQLKQDADGNWVNMGGPVTIMSIPTPGGIAYIISPKDTVLENIEYTPAPAPGQPAFKASRISADMSTPLQQHVEAITIGVAALEGMTKAEAEAMVRKWEEAGKMAPAVADVLKALIAAAFPPAALVP